MCQLCLENILMMMAGVATFHKKTRWRFQFFKLAWQLQMMLIQGITVITKDVSFLYIAARQGLQSSNL